MTAMSARTAFLWLAVLTIALAGLTILVHTNLPQVPAPRRAAPNTTVQPASDTPTLTAGIAAPVSAVVVCVPAA
jgi:hypothetical protein